MAKTDISQIQGKLDTIVEATSKTNVKVAVIEEHLRNMNGRLVKHDKELEEAKKEIEKNKDDIIFAKGSIYALSFLAVIIGLFVGAKTLGFI